MPDLSVIIPARNEEWLGLTVKDVLSHAKADTEIIVILDGAWPKEPLEQHPQVQIIYVPEAIGQRAATNLGAKVSTAKYLMKLDAHCAVADGFDVELIRTAEELGPDVTQIPAQHNLWIYDRICEKCGKREYQGSMDAQCVVCGDTTWKQEIIWSPIRRRTEFWRFDTEPKFAYWGEFKNRPEAKGEIVDVMTSLGACFFMERKRFWDIDGFDPSYGIWGSYAIELALKSWLSGGRHVTNRRTWFSHFFRVGGLQFPYPITGSQQEAARQRTRDIWYENAWPKQILPLSWLIEKFAPLPVWHEASGAATLDRVMLAGAAFTARQQSGNRAGVDALQVVGVLTDETHSVPSSQCEGVLDGRQEMTADAVCSSSLLSGETVPSQEIVSLDDLPQMGRITATSVIASVVNDQVVAGDSFQERTIYPGGQDTVDVGLRAISATSGESDSRISRLRIQIANPVPASSSRVDDDLGKDASELLAVEVGNGEILSGSHASSSRDDVRSGAGRVSARAVPPILPKTLSKSIVYYSDCRIDPEIDEVCRASIERSGLPIIAVTLKPIDWPAAINVVVPLERGYLTLFKQILIGLEIASSDVVFFAEHDCKYHEFHWEFIPPSPDVYYYQMNWLKVDAATGRAVTYVSKQTSQLCANRELLVQHYRTRVERVERDGFNRSMGFEPGSHGRKERVDNIPSDVWRSAAPNYDIRHAHNLTPSRWSRDQFRSQRNCQGWQESHVDLSEVFGGQIQQAFA